MPTYVYKIIETGETFEIEQRIVEPALTRHPQTGQAVKRVIQPVGIAFKGSGFYVNDSRSGGNGSAAAKPAAAAGETAKPSEAPKAASEGSAASSSAASPAS